ncbi:MAG TPA: hypothetical protein DE316_05860, partial [Eubacterium sp.]|nr:hypothetical protein [Eubacterium sp.]
MSENSIRLVTVGRKNWLFCDTTDGADASMMVFSLLETVRANGIYCFIEPLPKGAHFYFIIVLF